MFTAKEPNKHNQQVTKRRREIIGAALKVFADKGYAGSTIADVGSAARMSPGLLYHYFPGKEALLKAVIESQSFLPQVIEIVQLNSGLPVSDFLKTLAVNFYHLLGERAELMSIFLREGRSNDTVRLAWQKLLSSGMRLIKAYFDAQIAAGRLRQHNT